MAIQKPTKCAHCGTKIEFGKTLWVAPFITYQRPFCKHCYNDWFDMRDEVVMVAFKEYIGETKVQAKSKVPSRKGSAGQGIMQ